MAVTGIELTPDCCVVVAARAAGDGTTRLAAARRIELVPGEASSERLTQELAEARRALRLPRRAAIVDWTRGALRQAVTAAGFEIETVQSPAEAVAALAARSGIERSTLEADAWVVLHDTRAALAIVSGGDVLVSRVLTWPPPQMPRPSATTHLLRRYLLVAQVTPYIQNAADVTRRRFGMKVASVRACGDASDLPGVSEVLAQEIRRPVEMLDAVEALRVDARRVEVPLAALRLAAAAAATAPSAATPPHRLLPRVAAAALLIALGLGVRSQFSVDEPVPHAVSVQNLPTDVRPTGFDRKSRSDPAPLQPLAPRVPRREVEPTTGRGTPRAVDGPTCEAVFIGAGTRIAIVDGALVQVGDAVDGRTVTAIEEAGVTLRDASGNDLRLQVSKQVGTAGRSGSSVEREASPNRR